MEPGSHETKDEENPSQTSICIWQPHGETRIWQPNGDFILGTGLVYMLVVGYVMMVLSHEKNMKPITHI